MRRAAAVALVTVAVAGCGDRAQEPERAASLEEVCGTMGANASLARVAGLPGFPADGALGLVHDAPSHRPGAQITLLPVNRTREPQGYGAAHTLERRDGARWVDVPVSAGFRSWVATAAPGATGARCVTARLPQRPGRYRITQRGTGFRAVLGVG